MTDVAIPLTVRREVAFSRAVYEEHAVVEGMEAVLAGNFEEAERIMATRKIAVMVDEKAEVRKEYLPDVLVDGIMAKKNLGTRISDAPLVIGIGPGFTAAGDCHFVIETQRGEHLGEVIREGSAIPNTGIPGNIGGYTVERLLKASADGIMHPVARIGDVVKKEQIVARLKEEQNKNEILLEELTEKKRELETLKKQQKQLETEKERLLGETAETAKK